MGKSANIGNGGCSALIPPCFIGTYGGSVTTNISSDIQGAVRARLGYAWNRLLFFGAGGVALANFNLQSNLGGQNPNEFYYAAAQDRSTTRVGWTLGAGLEYALNSNWSVRTDYRYSDFGHITETPTSFSDGGEYYRGGRHVTQNQLEVGFSYRFADPDPEPAPGALVVKGPAASDLPSIKGGPAPTAYAANWTGFYLGGQAGYAYGDNHGAYNYGAPGLAGFLAGAAPLTGDAQGVLFGGHLGSICSSTRSWWVSKAPSTGRI